MSYLTVKCMLLLLRKHKKLADAFKNGGSVDDVTDITPIPTISGASQQSPITKTTPRKAVQEPHDHLANDNSHSAIPNTGLEVSSSTSRDELEESKDNPNKLSRKTTRSSLAIPHPNRYNYSGTNPNPSPTVTLPPSIVNALEMVTQLQSNATSQQFDSNPAKDRDYNRQSLSSNTFTINQSDSESSTNRNSQSNSRVSLSVQRKPSVKNSKKHLFNTQQSTVVKVIVTMMIIGVSCMYLIFGIGFGVSVSLHFENSDSICSNPGESVLIKHPELYLWDQCVYQTFPFTSLTFWLDLIHEKHHASNCNCRQAKIDLSSFSNSFTITPSNVNFSNNGTDGCDYDDLSQNHMCLIVESLLINWNMLEILHITDNSARMSISLTDSKHYNSIHLKILHFENIAVTGLGDNIDKWKNLEYFYISHSYFQYWPESFENLNKISFLKLSESYLSDLPSNLCDMKNLRSINIAKSFSTPYPAINSLPDCITKLNLLQSILFYSSDISRFPVGLFNMPNIAEIGFIVTDQIDITSFLDLINKTINSNDHNNQFTWNEASQTVYSFRHSLLCEQLNEASAFEVENRYELANIEILLQFINETGACDEICDIESLETLSCTAFIWQNGVCDDVCNSDSCNFDGGDCSQLCQMYSPGCSSLSLFGNQYCDIVCNTSWCNYDNYQCISEIDVTFPSNWTHCNSESNLSNTANGNVSLNLCPIEWVGDEWCDNNCYSSDSCFNDGNDCKCAQDSSSTNCQKFISAFNLLGIGGDNEYQATSEAVCAVWAYLSAFASPDYESDGSIEQNFLKATIDYYLNNSNCSIAFSELDINSDGYLAVTEVVQTFGEYLDVSQQKAKQINCTFAIACS